MTNKALALFIFQLFVFNSLFSCIHHINAAPIAQSTMVKIIIALKIIQIILLTVFFFMFVMLTNSQLASFALIRVLASYLFFKYFNKYITRYFNTSLASCHHFFLAFFLFLKQLTLSRHITTIKFCSYIFSHS